MVIGKVLRKYRSTEDYSRDLGVNRRLVFLCKTHTIRFIDPWAIFFGKDNIFQRNGTHFSTHGARVFARLLNSRLFKPVAPRSWGQGRAGPSAPPACAPSNGVAAKHDPQGSPYLKLRLRLPLCLLLVLLQRQWTYFRASIRGGTVWLPGGRIRLTLQWTLEEPSQPTNWTNRESNSGPQPEEEVQPRWWPRRWATWALPRPTSIGKRVTIRCSQQLEGGSEWCYWMPLVLGEDLRLGVLH